MESNNAQDFLKQFQSYASQIGETKGKIAELGQQFDTDRIQKIFQENLLKNDEDREKAEAVSAFVGASGLIPTGLMEFHKAYKNFKRRRAGFGKDRALEGESQDATEISDLPLEEEAPSQTPEVLQNVEADVADVAPARGAVEDITEASDAIAPEVSEAPELTQAPVDAEDMSNLLRQRIVQSIQDAQGRPSVARWNRQLEQYKEPQAESVAQPVESGNAEEAVAQSSDNALTRFTDAGQTETQVAGDVGGADIGEAIGEDVAEQVAGAGLREAGILALSTALDFAGPLGILASIGTSAYELEKVLTRKKPRPQAPQPSGLTQTAFGRVKQAVAPAVDTAATITGGISAF